jgi:hypothetical protein
MVQSDHFEFSLVQADQNLARIHVGSVRMFADSLQGERVPDNEPVCSFESLLQSVRHADSETTQTVLQILFIRRNIDTGRKAQSFDCNGSAMIRAQPDPAFLTTPDIDAFLS